MSHEIEEHVYMQAYMDDCDRKTEAQGALIHELVAALDGIEKMLDQQGALIQQELVNALARQQLNARLIVLKAIRHAKQAGYEPTKTTNEHPYSRDKLGEDC